MDKALSIISWDEINLEATTTNEDGPDQTATDDELLAHARAIYKDEEKNDEDEEPEYSWKAKGVTRGPNTATIEWRSDRNHLATTTFIWF